MKRMSAGGWFGVGAIGAFVFCLSLCAIVRSCELARMGVATIVSFDELRAIRAEIQRSRHAVPDRR
jgi:hypothetical protein